MAVTVQEAEVLFSATGMTRVQSASMLAGKAMDKLTRSGAVAARGMQKAGSVGVKSMRSLGSAAGSAADAIGSVATRAATVGFAAGAAGAAAMLKLAADAEKLNTQFKVLTGSEETATKLMGDIDKFAASTPFQKMDIADAARQLLAFGGSADTAVDELRMLGDLAAGTGQPLGELAELYGKAKVQGRLFGEDINQLTGRGIPIIQALAKEFGVADGEVKQLVTDGKIGFPEMQRALAGMTGPGGKFAGMMDELSGTTAGKFSTFVDNVKLLGTEFGEQLLPYANDLLDWSTDFVGRIDGVDRAFTTAIETGKTWYTELSNWMQDAGVVAGVFVDNYKTAFKGLFKDIVSYAGAAFQWLQQNSRALILNMVEMAKNAPSILENTGRRIGEEAAFALGLSDEVLKIDPLAGVPMKRLTEFNGPEFSKETQSVMASIEKELAASREQRTRDAEKLSKAADTISTGSPAAIAAGFVSKDKTIASVNKKDVAKAQVQRGSASSVFNRLQDQLMNRQMELSKQQLKEQQNTSEQVAGVKKAVEDGLGKFVPVLG